MHKIGEKKGLLDILIRYSIIVFIGLFATALFYTIFRPITTISTFSLLDIVFDPLLAGDRIIINHIPLILIDACIAGSAYFLLLLLNLATPRIELIKRMAILLTSFMFFLAINILRISFLGWLYFSGLPLFDLTHKLFWYLLSTVIVVGIWFLEVKFFKIKEIPFYSDLKNIYSKSVFKK